MYIDTSQAMDTVRRLAEGFLSRLPTIGIALVVFALFFLVSVALRSGIRNVNDRLGHSGNIGLVLGRLAQGVVILLGLLVALVIAVPGFQPGQLIQVLGLSTVAIGFAFQDIFKNFLAGILILLGQPFRIGDQIVAQGGKYEGTVEEIQTRATFLRTYDGRRVVIPNADLFSDSVIVNTAFETRRLEYDFGIGFGDDIAEAKRIIRETLEGTEGVLSDPAPEVLLVSLGDFSVNLRARWWTTPPRKSDTLAVQDRVITAIAGNLLANGIDLPFPTHQVLFHDQTEETDGDRRRQREGWPVPQEGDPPVPRPIGTRRQSDRRMAVGREPALLSPSGDGTGRTPPG
jgi:small conductance mechanosensitive channel